MHVASMVSRYWPFANGSGRILDKFARKVDLGSGVRVARTSDGFPLQVYAEDLIGRHLLMSGKFDRSIIDVLLSCARPGDTLVDIGANIGYVSACFLHRFQDGEAYCIEPQPGVVDLLRENMSQFGKRARVMETALGEETGEVRFVINQRNRGKSRVSEKGDVVVPMHRAAGLFGSFHKVNLLKIDVEGHELPIFRSLEPELSRLRPRAIMFEDHADGAAPGGPIGCILRRVGYTIYCIEKRLTRTRLRRVQSRDDCRSSDYLAAMERK